MIGFPFAMVMQLQLVAATHHTIANNLQDAVDYFFLFLQEAKERRHNV
jgi:hypothetical protein